MRMQQKARKKCRKNKKQVAIGLIELFLRKNFTGVKCEHTANNYNSHSFIGFGIK
jgi:hypothetical protein